MLAAHNQLSSGEKGEQAISATDRPAVLHVLEIHDRAAMNSYKTRRTKTRMELLERRANSITQTTRMNLHVIGCRIYELNFRR